MLVANPEFGEFGLSKGVGSLGMSGLPSKLEEGVVEVLLSDVEALLFSVHPRALYVGVVLWVCEVSVGLTD